MMAAVNAEAASKKTSADVQTYVFAESMASALASEREAMEAAKADLEGIRGGVVRHEPRPRPGPGQEKPRKNKTQAVKNYGPGQEKPRKTRKPLLFLSFPGFPSFFLSFPTGSAV